jgi:3-oxoacyl-(acyl-carrier-protein) synthase
MNVFVQGLGAVTPLGPTALKTWAALCGGQRAPRQKMPACLGNRDYYWCPVPAKFTTQEARLPRLRRSGTISLLGAAAGFNAFSESGLKSSNEMKEGTALIFAICSGGVIYTRRLYHEIVTQGANAASPVLFPETVYNAAASHMAALLGLDAECYTLVGDSSVGLSALHFAAELLLIRPELDRCLVVGTEEVDWLLADAFASWRMATTKDVFEVYGHPRGTVFAEGAAAVLVGRTGSVRLSGLSAGQSFFSRRDSISVAIDLFGKVLAETSPDLIVSSANGTFADEVERVAFSQLFGTVPVYAPKPAIGEALGAGALFQLVVAVLALRHRQIPGTLDAGSRLPTINRQTRPHRGTSAIVTCVGFNQQINAVALEVDPEAGGSGYIPQRRSR